METFTVEEQLPQHEVYISVRDEDLRLKFVSHLIKDLESYKINSFINEYKDDRGQSLLSDVLFQKIEESKIALVIFSERYTESNWCLKELYKIKDCLDNRRLVVIPIFYEMQPYTVRNLTGKFGYNFRELAKGDERKRKWKEALIRIPDLMGITINKESIESKKVDEIVVAVKKTLNIISSERIQNANVGISGNSNASALSRGGTRVIGVVRIEEDFKEKMKEVTFGIKQSLKICRVLLLLFCLQQFTYMTTPLLYGITEKFTGKETKFFNSKVKPPNIQVFINFRGDQLRRNFISYLVDALQRSEVNVFIDKKEQIGEDLNKLFKRIEGSGIAIVVFSSRYTESKWCLEELAKIKERAHEGLLKVLPIYYKVTITNVKRLKGEFGDHFRDKEHMYQTDEAKIKRWKEAIEFVSQKFALSLVERSTALECEFVQTIVEEVLRILQDIPQ